MDPTIRIALIILIPLIISLVVCLIFRSQMKTARIARTADNYIPMDGFNLKVQIDTFLYRTTSSRRINTQPNKR